MRMIIYGEHVKHQVCETCPGGLALAKSIEAGNASMPRHQQDAINEVEQNTSDAIGTQPQARDYFEEVGRQMSAKILATGGLSRVICQQDGPSLFRGCGARAVPNA